MGFFFETDNFHKANSKTTTLKKVASRPSRLKEPSTPPVADLRLVWINPRKPPRLSRYSRCTRGAGDFV